MHVGGRPVAEKDIRAVWGIASGEQLLAQAGVVSAPVSWRSRPPSEGAYDAGRLAVASALAGRWTQGDRGLHGAHALRIACNARGSAIAPSGGANHARGSGTARHVGVGAQRTSVPSRRRCARVVRRVRGRLMRSQPQAAPRRGSWAESASPWASACRGVSLSPWHSALPLLPAPVAPVRGVLGPPPAIFGIHRSDLGISLHRRPSVVVGDTRTSR